tara:strand:+ start:774 stop:1856 length:1083 start_codon:yes stop_codon:yes gene_type:complete
MTERLVRTHNIFIDTAKARVESRTKGDDFALHLNTMAVDADRNEFIRLTLNNFAMTKTWTDVNNNNNGYYLAVNGVYVSIPFLTKQNYKNVSDLASDFATSLGNSVVANYAPTSFTIANLAPASTTTINGTSDNIISFDLVFNVAHTITTKFQLFCIESQRGDSAYLLGGDMYSKDEADNLLAGTTSSFNCSVVTNTTLRVQAFYPAQRFTEPYVYLRTSLPTSATETASITQEDNVNEVSEASSSNILAKIPVNTEMVVFNSQTGREFFLDLRQKHLNNITLYLTDSKNRRLGRRPDEGHLNTASGTGSNQSTRGNLNFNAVFRVEVIKELGKNESSFGPPTPSTRMNNLLVDPSKKPF